MRDASRLILNRAIELFAESFDRLFIESLQDRIPDAARRRQVGRVIGEISDAAAQRLARFLKEEPPEGVDIDSLFDAVRRAVAAIGPELWRAPLSDDRHFAGRLQVELVDHLPTPALSLRAWINTASST